MSAADPLPALPASGSHSIRPPATLAVRPPAALILIACLPLGAVAPAPLAAQTLAPRGQVRTGAAPKPRTLAIRESVLTLAVRDSTASYRAEEGSQTFVLTSSEGKSTVQWSIGGEERPLSPNPQTPARVVEKRVRFLPHGDRLFVKIETVAKGTPGREEEEVRFSGTYEATLAEGTWADRDTGKALEIRLTAADHQRYLGEMRQAHFGKEVLASHADRFRRELLSVLERKLADPGTTPASEIALARHLVTFVKAHPETFVVTVTPSFDAEPEVFLLQGGKLSSTTARQTTTLRFDARLPAIGPAAP